MALTRVYGRVVRPHGDDALSPVTGDGVIEYVHSRAGVLDGAVHGPDRVKVEYVDGVAADAWLKPGAWRGYVTPQDGRAYDCILGVPDTGDALIADVIGVEVDDKIITKGDRGERGERGPEGAPGPAGPRGDAGPAGPKGDAGDEGPQGIQGERGPEGERGAEGPEGPEGPQGPKGDRGETGPKGDKGDAGDRGATGDTGPASTVPGPAGPPGAVPTSSSHLVVGPGRPDQPATTGLTAAQINALPVGAEYRSSDGPQGAWGWVKRPSGWAVTEGDTGWRAISLGTPYATGATIRVRRTPELVYAAHGNPQLWTQWNPGVAKTTGVATNKAWDGAQGFIPDNRTIALIYNGDTGAIVGAVGWSTEGSGFVGLTHTATTGMVFELQAACTRAWPTSLPGSAA